MNKKWLVVGAVFGAVAIALIPGAGLGALAVGAYKRHCDKQRAKAERDLETRVNEQERAFRLGAGC